MVNYQNGKIYKIVDNTNGNVYIGSTTEKYLSRRLQGHRDQRDCICRRIIDNGDYHIELIETWGCNNKDELHQREQYWMDNTECINKKKAYQPLTRKEYKKQYRCDNREKIKLDKQKRWKYFRSWGDTRFNLLFVDPFLFQ